ncbi:membrane-associated protein, putative, partial [Bodo saltans]
MAGYINKVILCLLLGSFALADVVSRASAPITASSATGCGYDNVRLHFVCLICSTTSCGIYSIAYRGTPYAERSDIPNGAVTAKSFTVQSGRRLAYIYYSNSSLLQYNLDSFAAAPLDTGFTFTSATSSVCGSVTLSAPAMMTVTLDGRAYGVLTTSSTCANTLHVVEYIVPLSGSTTGGGQATIVLTLATTETAPGTVVSITTAGALSGSSAVVFVALSGGGTCSTVSYVKLVPRASTPSAAQVACGAATCLLSSSSVGSSVMIAYRDFYSDLIVTQRNCQLVASISTSGTTRVFSGIGQSGYQDGYATSEAKLASPSSPTTVNDRRVFLLTADSIATNLVGRLTGATTTASATKTVSIPTKTQAGSSTVSWSGTFTTTITLSTSASTSKTLSSGSSVSTSPSPSLPTLTNEESATESPSHTWSPSIASRTSSATPLETATPTSTTSLSSTGEPSSSSSFSTSSSQSLTRTFSWSSTHTTSRTETEGTSTTFSETQTATLSLSSTPSTTHNITVTVNRSSPTVSASSARSVSASPSRSGVSSSLGISASDTSHRISLSRSHSRRSATASPSRSSLDSISNPNATLTTSLSSLTTSVTEYRSFSSSATITLSHSLLTLVVVQHHPFTFSLSPTPPTSLTLGQSTTLTSSITVTSTLTQRHTATASQTSSPTSTVSESISLFVPKPGDSSNIAVIVGSVLGCVGGVAIAVIVYYVVFHSAAAGGGAPAATPVGNATIHAPDGEAIEAPHTTAVEVNEPAAHVQAPSTPT